MTKNISRSLSISFIALALLISSCSTNATITKRYHSRGFNIAWGGGGSDANNNVVKQTPKKVKSKSDMIKVAQYTESLAVQTVNSSENAIVNPANQNPELYSNALMTQNGTSVNNYFKSTSDRVKSSNSLTKTVKANVVSKPIIKANQKKYDPRNGRSWGAAMLICLLLGMFGLHRFYLGYNKIGLIQLVFGALYFSTNLWWTGFIVIWVIIDSVRILTKDLEPNGGYYS
jgi:TM2 domain-containing membrane protein YozV/uncharacterized protein (UPF0333 family)